MAAMTGTHICLPFLRTVYVLRTDTGRCRQLDLHPIPLLPGEPVALSWHVWDTGCPQLHPLILLAQNRAPVLQGVTK